MQKLALMLLGVGLVLSSIFPALTVPDDRSYTNPAVAESLPAYDGGYGYDSVTATMYDHNGFAYSYLPDGIIRLTLPWGYVTYFSFGLTGSYLGIPQKVSALDYTWTWDAQVDERLNETGASLGYDYTFTATNSETLDWAIELSFSAVVGEHMKVTHTVVNGYPNALTGVEFWYLFDLTHTPEPCVTTTLGTYYPPLYSVLPDSVTWLRLSNQFQFDWRDADYPNGHAYLGDGSVVGVSVDILGVSLVLGDILPGGSRVIDPYFSGVTRTWNAGAASYSGIAASWSPVGVPATGDNITFDGTSVFNCNWNTSVTLGDFAILTAYTGTVSVTTSFGMHDCLIQTAASGGFSGGTIYTVTILGNFTIGAVSRFQNSLIDLNGTGLVSVVAGTEARRWTVSGVYTIQGIVYAEEWVITNTGSFSGSTPLGIIGWRMGTARASWSCQGTLNFVSPSYVYFYFTGSSTLNQVVNPGTLNTYLLVSMTSSCTGNRVVSLSADATFTTIHIESSHATYGPTLATNSNSLVASTIVSISSRGKIDQSAGGVISTVLYTQPGIGSSFTQGDDIICTSTWSQTAGAFTADSHDILIGGNMAVSGTAVWTPGTGRVVMYGTSKTLGTPSGDTFYNLKVNGTVTTTSSINVTNDLDVSGTLTVGAGKTATWTTNGTLSNTGTIAGTGAFAIDLSMDYSLDLGEVTAPTIIGIPAWASMNRTLSLAVATELQADLTVEAEVTLDPNDMVVTFSDDMELDLSASAGSSLWNCTVAAGVTVTLTADVTVQLRATVLGTVTGADFLEPAPEFTSSPELTIDPLTAYSYTPTQLYWDTLGWDEYPDWLFMLNGDLTGVPTEADAGFHNVSLSLTWNDMTTYQNFTIFVAYTPTVDMPWFTTTMSLILSVVLGFGCLILGLVFQMHYLTFFSGLIWLFSALGVYSDINIGWTVLSIALGMMLMMIGGAKIAGE